MPQRHEFTKPTSETLPKDLRTARAHLIEELACLVVRAYRRKTFEANRETSAIPSQDHEPSGC